MNDETKFAPLCIWCSAPWSDENIQVENFDCADQCDSGRIDDETVTVSIVCHACNREMYRKVGVSERFDDDPHWMPLPDPPA